MKYPNKVDTRISDDTQKDLLEYMEFNNRNKSDALRILICDSISGFKSTLNVGTELTPTPTDKMKKG